MRPHRFWIWLSPVVLAFSVIGFAAARAMYAREESESWDAATAAQIRAMVRREYVDEIGEEQERKLFYAAMQAYLEGLDPYCSFFDPDERRRMEEDTSGQFGGVGVLVRTEEGELRIVGLRRDDPAHAAGVELGDVIVQVDGRDTTELPMGEVTPLIRGAPGSPLTLGVRRDGQVLRKSLVRSHIKIDSVVGVRIVDPEHAIGYLRVGSFQENTGEQAGRALRHLLEQGARSIVLDLRQNHGGVLEKGAVSLVDHFLTEGPIVETRGRIPGSFRVYEASRDGTLCPEEPLAVLVDGDSASAAEVVAGAFQDRRRGILVGERTYGKFLVQSIHMLPQGEVAISLTTARYFTPFGRWLQRNEREGVRGGLLPDVVVPRSEEETRALMEEVFARQHGLDMIVSEEGRLGRDEQLSRAVQMLTDLEELGR